MNKRNLNYDLIRLLGLIIIMVAHSSPPAWLFQLRNFGTPLLVVGSGLTYALIYASKRIDIKNFYRKRFARLIFPAWIFLSFFFFVFYCIAYVFGKNFPFDSRTILSSYLFMGGIGFVWVFKIYLMLAVVTPLAIYINARINNNFIYLMILFIAYLIYEFSNYFLSSLLYGVYKTIFNSIVFILIPYTIIYLYAFRLSQLKRNIVVFISIFSLILFFLMLIEKYNVSGSFVPTQEYKYPPTIYYLSYAFFAINFVFLILTKIKLSNDVIKPKIIWLSANSLWIYLWHIFAFYLWKYVAPDPDGNLLLFLVKTASLFAFGILCTILQNKLVSSMPIRNSIWKYRVAPLLSSNA